MKRFRITIEYDGTFFVGWQRQENGLGVQEVLEDAIEKLSGQRAHIQCAGRTDAGVHALAQVAHFDLTLDWTPEKIRGGLNHHIGSHQISILAAKGVNCNFNARFDAIQRSYLYLITNRRAPLALKKGRSWWIPVELDVFKMEKAARSLIGKHDFSTFRASYCQARSSIKTLDHIDVKRNGDDIEITLMARSFLHHQVRNIVGTLRLVGEGKWTLQDFKNALKAKDRTQGGQTAPASGLYLVSVNYN